jgi:predicted transcriptional regulator
MKLREWLKTSETSIRSFARKANVERAMVYRYMSGAMPRPRTMQRIELLTDGAVTAQDFYDNAMEQSRGLPLAMPNLGSSTTNRLN